MKRVSSKFGHDISTKCSLLWYVLPNGNLKYSVLKIVPIIHFATKYTYTLSSTMYFIHQNTLQSSTNNF